MVIHEGMQVEAYNSESSVSFRIIQHLCRLSTTSKVFSNLSDSLRNILNRWMALLLQVQMNWGRRLAAWQRTLLSSKFTCLKTFCRHSICCSKQSPCSTFFFTNAGELSIPWMDDQWPCKLSRRQSCVSLDQLVSLPSIVIQPDSFTTQFFAGSSEPADSWDNNQQPGELTRGHPAPPWPDEAQEAAGGPEEEGEDRQSYQKCGHPEKSQNLILIHIFES